MKRFSRKSAWAALTILNLGTVISYGKDCEEMIQKVLLNPGDFVQNCNGPVRVAETVPLPLYKLILQRWVFLGAKELEQLRQNRAGVVPTLVDRLSEVDLSKPAKAPAQDEFLGPGSPDMTNQLSGPLFEIIIGLDAVEALPELLAVEDHLNRLILAADASSEAQPAYVVLDGDFWIEDRDNGLPDREKQQYSAKIVQRELLSVICQLLRRQRFQPLLDSEIEKKYAAAIRERAAEPDLKDIKTPSDVPEKDKDWLKFDPIYNIPLRYISDSNRRTLPYSEELRQTIRTHATEFLKVVPAEQWKTAPDEL